MSEIIEFGACKYCGQIALVNAKTEAEAAQLATQQCDCAEAVEKKVEV